MDVAEFLKRLKSDPEYRRQIAYVKRLPARKARYAEPSEPVAEPVRRMLVGQGIERLYVHQAEAIDHARQGRDVVVVTGTASGKTLCYNVPVLEGLLADPEARALYLFPTKALSQDQLKALESLTGPEPELARRARAVTYDGDTPPTARRRARSDAAIVLTNPDMLHVSLLPYHSKWARFFARLRYVVVDEVHTYRGIFGSHVANVLRRLQRVTEHYGSRPVFVCSSATIANPAELAGGITGRAMQVVDDDGSPRGVKHLVLWNPPYLEHRNYTRRSANIDAKDLMVRLIESDVQTIAFSRTRVAAELISRYVTETLKVEQPKLARSVAAYRGGYLPEERRKLEKRLASGKLKGVASTNALELGIDIGGLDAAVLVGYPGTICSLWQQAGRAGRRRNESLVVLVAYNDPIDQYMMRHPEYLLSRNPEHGAIDPANPYILQGHVACAAFELPITAADSAVFGDLAEPLAEILAEDGQLKAIDGQYYWATSDYPAGGVSLRNISDKTFTILDTTGGTEEAIGNVDSISAPELVYPGGIYLHEGQAYQVDELDFEGKVARVHQTETDYYTQAVLEHNVKIVGQREEKPHTGASVHYGDLAVTWRTVAFTRHVFFTQQNLGVSPVDIPSQTLTTTGLWLVPEEGTCRRLAEEGYKPMEAMVGLRNMLMVTLPLLSMADPRDISANADSSNLGRMTVFGYDRYPGGVGFAQKGYDLVDRLLAMSRQVVSECPCRDGCPSCVGVPQLRPPIHSDPDLGSGYPIPNKAATQLLLRLLTE